jgi:hypothetical protein
MPTLAALHGRVEKEEEERVEYLDRREHDEDEGEKSERESEREREIDR